MAENPGKVVKKKRGHKKQEKDSNSWENVIREIEDLSDDEKWHYVEFKYKETHQSFLETSEQLKTSQKQNESLEVERTNLSKEATRLLWSQTKMESLARELQKHNRELKVI